MKILFYLVHPAHFHLFKNLIKALENNGNSVFIIIRPKESLEQLCKDANFSYSKVTEGKRNNSKIGIIADILWRDLKALRLIRSFRPDIMIGSSVEICHVGSLLGIPSILTHEDDFDNMKFFANITFPFATKILSPNNCRQGKWERKCIHYPSYHELAYLHPDVFQIEKDRAINNEQEVFYLLRFSQFNAHHDFGISGISDGIANRIIEILAPTGNVYISSERPLPPDLLKYQLTISPANIHDLLARCRMFISDSQSMTVEAAVLGIPSIRFNRFASNVSISVIDELENKYKLTIGINSSNPEELLQTIRMMNDDSSLHSVWNMRREQMLADKINPNAFFLSFIENYFAK